MFGPYLHLLVDLTEILENLAASDGIEMESFNLMALRKEFQQLSLE